MKCTCSSNDRHPSLSKWFKWRLLLSLRLLLHLRLLPRRRLLPRLRILLCLRLLLLRHLAEYSLELPSEEAVFAIRDVEVAGRDLDKWALLLAAIIWPMAAVGFSMTGRLHGAIGQGCGHSRTGRSGLWLPRRRPSLPLRLPRSARHGKR